MSFASGKHTTAMNERRMAKTQQANQIAEERITTAPCDALTVIINNLIIIPNVLPFHFVFVR